jgi:hypothetical protein
MKCAQGRLHCPTPQPAVWYCHRWKSGKPWPTGLEPRFGTCMYPTVRSGDVLQIESRRVEQVIIGEIAVCRRQGYLFGHRTIAKGCKDGRPYIVTRPDRTRHGNDGPTYDQDLLGVATAIARGRRRISPPASQASWPSRGFVAARITLLERSMQLKVWLANVLTSLQQRDIYRRSTRLLLAPMDSRLSYGVRMPLPVGDLYRPLSVDEFDVRKPDWRGRPVDRWILTLHLHDRSRPAAWADLILRPPECPVAGWRINDMHVRKRYLGIGLEDALLAKANEILARGGRTLLRSPS